jgi:predicted nucleic acid-binding protein
VEISSEVRALAQTVTPSAVRTLDAIHLATALRLGEQLTSLVTYDRRLADAATAAGLTVDGPAA